MLALLDQLAIELGILGFAVVSVWLSFHKQTVVNLKPILLPQHPSARPELQSRHELELMELGFDWVGDFDASSVENVVTLARFYASPDRLHYAMFVNLRSQLEERAIIEFNTNLSPRGSISTNNNSQPGIYKYRPEKLVVRVPWKKSIRDLFKLHQQLCDAVLLHGFTPQPVQPSHLPADVSADSRADIEGEYKHGRLRALNPDLYVTTFKGALAYTPRLWFNFTHSLLFSWCRASDQTLLKRAKLRFARASRQMV